MDPLQAIQVATRIAIEQTGDNKLALLDACATLGAALGHVDQAQLAANLAANLRAADASEQALLDLINPIPGGQAS